MGQCVSRKSVGAFAASADAAHNRPTAMHKHKLLKECQNEKETTTGSRKPPTYTRGVATSFGFRRRPTTAPAIVTDNAVAARRLANTELIDRNGNGGHQHNTTEHTPLNSSPIPSGRTTPRLAPPKKEANATRINRFGFRQANSASNRLNRVADANAGPQPIHLEYKNNNGRSDAGPPKSFYGNNDHLQQHQIARPKSRNVPPQLSLTTTKVNIHSNSSGNSSSSSGSSPVTADSNRNKNTVKTSTTTATALPQQQSGRYLLQSTQLPRPQVPVHVMETKLAKTAANNNKKSYGVGLRNLSTAVNNTDDGSSSKEGSLIEDSGIGSHSSAIEMLDSSPTFGRRRFRNLEMVVNGNNFDVRDLDESADTAVPLPKLPSAFHNHHHYHHQPHPSSGGGGVVRERAMEYERQLEKNLPQHHHQRKISNTSSEGFSDDWEMEKFRKERRSEKNSFSGKTFLKPTDSFITSNSCRREVTATDSTPPSSDEHEWANAGEAMADDFSCSFSSSDESKDKNSPLPSRVVTTSSISSALQNLMNTSVNGSVPKTQIRNVLMSLEDPKFAAVAAASSTVCLLDEETSPVDSLLCSISEADDLLGKKKNNNLHSSSSNSKDINEKLTMSPESPGTPTNASNSLSLSEGRDFLIDDEIADQPALVFDDTLTTVGATERSQGDVAQPMSDNTPTLVDSTPKVRRKFLLGCDGSPLPLRAKSHLLSRTASVDTLSPCESIASDDLMMDFDHSHSSGFDDSVDRLDQRGIHSLDGPGIMSELETTQEPNIIREWSSLLNTQNYKESPTNVARSRLLRSRAGTPNSIPDSPKSLDSHVNVKSRGAAHSPLRGGHRGTLGASPAFDSDESLIRVDKASHGAMLQDIVGIKTMLLKLKRVLHETDEDILMRSETLNPFDTNQSNLKNGLFNNGLGSDAESVCDSVTSEEESSTNTRVELADLRRQIEFLQGQLEDRERTVKLLQVQMAKIVETSNSAPASTVTETSTCNAATQTERVRPLSAGPSLLQSLQSDQNGAPLVSATEKKSRPSSATVEHHHHHPHQNGTMSNTRMPPPKLWRKPGEPPSPSRFSPASSPSSIPRRANSRTRVPSTPS